MRPTNQYSLTYRDFELAFGEELSLCVRNQIQKYNLDYYELSLAQRDKAIKRIVDVLLDPSITRSGEHRKSQWEDGWGENLEEYSNTTDQLAILPKYFGKYPILRWKGEFIRPASREVEYNMLSVLLDWLFDSYFRNADTIYEFGCGTGHNLIHARQYNRKGVLWGLDWASSSQNIIDKLREDKKDKAIYSHNFDYFHPDNTYRLNKNGIVFTVASLEQVGINHKPFTDYLLENHPKLCIHIEPIAELLDDDKLLDYLSIQYFNKRNYLSGFLTSLRKLERQGRVKIHKAQRSYIGSYFVDGYSIVVWEPTQ